MWVLKISTGFLLQQELPKTTKPVGSCF
jgi:hypothetical protein